jgi:hypothetical protein
VLGLEDFEAWNLALDDLQEDVIRVILDLAHIGENTKHLLKGACEETKKTFGCFFGLLLHWLPSAVAPSWWGGAGELWVWRACRRVQTGLLQQPATATTSTTDHRRALQTPAPVPSQEAKAKATPNANNALRSGHNQVGQQRRDPQIFGPPGKPSAWLVARHSAS